MKTIFSLTKIQMGSALDFINVFRKKNANRKKSAGALTIFIIAFLFFSFISTVYAFSLTMLLEMSGELDTLNGLMMAVACMVILMTTIYKASSTLFGQKDFDTLMSLPIKTSYIVASRLLVLYILNFFFVAVIMLPSTIIYGVKTLAPVTYYIYSVIGILIIPFVPMVAASAIGILFGIVSARFKRNNIVNIIFTVILFIGVMGFSFMLNSESMLVELSVSINSMVKKIYPLASMYIDGTVKGEIIPLLLFILISAAAFTLFSIIVGKLFVRMNSFMTAIKSNRKFKMKEQKVRSRIRAIMYKEMKRLFSSVIYCMNSTVGVLMLVIGLIAICIVPREKLDIVLSVIGDGNLLIYIVIMAVCLCVSMVTSSSCSISLEGKNLWIIKSLPIDAKTYFGGKIWFNIALSVPFIIIAAITSIIIFRPGFIEILLLVITPFAYSLFTSVFGLRLNLRYPLFDWTNEAVVVKQSTAVMIDLFGGMFIAIIPIVGLIIPGFNPAVVMAVTATVLILWALLLWHGLNKKAEKVLYNLG